MGREKKMNTAADLSKARNHILFHHNPEESDGYITLCKKNRQGHFRQYHYRPEDLAVHLTEWMGEDVYFSQNTFYKPQRSIETIRQLKSLYVDLDFYIFNYDPEWIIGKLEAEFFRQSVPEPNLIIFSGQGIVLIWLIEPVPYKALPLWQAVQNYLLEQLKPLGGDPKAVDAARVFRIAGSINSKNDAPVHVEYRHDYRHTLRDIQFDYLPELKPYVEKKVIPKKRGRKKKIVHLYNTYTLHHSRLLDIVKLVELRNGDIEGMRETVCFLYRYWACCFTDSPQDALEQTISFNETFYKPLPRKEVEKATKSAEKAWKARSCAKANEIAISKGYPGAGYNISNAKLIKWLDISPEEQQHLLTIIGPKEKRRRKNIRQTETRRNNGIIPREEYLQKEQAKTLTKLEQLKQVMLQYPDYSNRKLASEMGVSESYIRKLKKQI